MKRIITLALFALILSGCEGPVGPAGESYGITHTFTYNMEDLVWESFSGHDQVVFEIPEITEAVMRSGAVLVYWNTTPVPVVIDIGDFSTVLSFATYVGQLQLFAYASDFQTSTGSSYAFGELKVVILDSGV